LLILSLVLALKKVLNKRKGASKSQDELSDDALKGEGMVLRSGKQLQACSKISSQMFKQQADSNTR